MSSNGQSMHSRSRVATLWRDCSLSALTAGFLAVLVSYAGPLAIYFHAAEVGHIPPQMVASWLWGISIGAAVAGIWLSWQLKAPVITAWSAPGTALLVTLLPTMPLSDMVGAYITAGLLLLLIGWTGYFDRLIQRIPRGVAAGMMAGILFQFGTQTFKSVAATPLLGGGMLLTYLVFRRILPRYCMVIVLLCGVALAMSSGGMSLPTMTVGITVPHLIVPSWSLASTFSLAIPLVIVSLSGQYLPGITILHGAGYRVSARPILVVTSLLSLLVACFGGITIVVAAITAALCTGPDAHEDPARRYIAGLANGGFYLLGGVFSGALVLLFVALSHELVAVLAGVALIGAITGNVASVVADEKHREAAMITFLTTASGMSFAGMGAAFWGVVIGSIAYLILRPRHRANAQ